MHEELAQGRMRPPAFITIGVTTYNRKEMLVECIKSILAQSFSDFEILIGNDYTQEKLSLRELGIADPRVRIVNHVINLGEIENMRFLLDQAEGEYFTWLADDDAYHPDFLSIAHDALRHDPGLDCVFSNYWSSDAWTSTPRINRDIAVATVYRPDLFLERYLTKQVALLGCYGVFKLDFIRKLGGMKRVGDGFGPYSDNLLGIKAAALGRIAYIDQPLIFYRIHTGSVSCSSGSLEAYTSAQSDVAREFERLVKKHVPAAAYYRLQFLLFDWFVCDLAAVWVRTRLNLRLSRLWNFIWLVRTSYIQRLSPRYKLRLGRRTVLLIYTITKQIIRHWSSSAAR
jgi:glycosyltransferase involved in cell wall biosynthesis